MEGYYGQVQPDALSKKDKKRVTIQNRLAKLNEEIDADRAYHYNGTLKNLQLQLMRAHVDENETVLERLRDFGEERDYELVRLSLWEKYEMERAEKEFLEDVERANREHDEMVKLVKERLYASLERQVKQLKEDKVLLDVANSHSYSMAMEPLAGAHEFQKHTRSQQKEKEKDHQPLAAMGYLSDRRGLRRRGGAFLGGNGNGNGNGNGGGNSSTVTRGGESGNEDSHLSANESGNNSSAKRSRLAQSHGNGAKYSSAEESWLSDAGDLSSLLFGERKPEKPSTRHTSKAYNAPQGLKNEEVADDLAQMKGDV